MSNDKEKSFLEIQQDTMETLGFWSEIYKSTLMKNTELMYKTEIIREWGITDIVLNDNKFLIKWDKRVFPLTDEYLKEKYGR